MPKYSKWQSNAPKAVRQLQFIFPVQKYATLYEFISSVCTRVRRVSHKRNGGEKKMRKKERMCRGKEGSAVNFFLLILSVKHQFYLLFANIFPLIRVPFICCPTIENKRTEPSTQQKCEKCRKEEKLLANSNRVVAIYIY